VAAVEVVEEAVDAEDSAEGEEEAEGSQPAGEEVEVDSNNIRIYKYFRFNSTVLYCIYIYISLV